MEDSSAEKDLGIVLDKLKTKQQCMVHVCHENHVLHRNRKNGDSRLRTVSRFGLPAQEICGP